MYVPAPKPDYPSAAPALCAGGGLEHIQQSWPSVHGSIPPVRSVLHTRLSLHPKISGTLEMAIRPEWVLQSLPPHHTPGEGGGRGWRKRWSWNHPEKEGNTTFARSHSLGVDFDQFILIMLLIVFVPCFYVYKCPPAITKAFTFGMNATHFNSGICLFFLHLLALCQVRILGWCNIFCFFCPF